MAADKMLHPDQFGEVKIPWMGEDATLKDLHDLHYSRHPQYMRSLQRNIQRNGFQHPVELSDSKELIEGHHRASVAYRLKIPFPTVPEGTPQSDAYQADTSRWHAKERDIHRRNAGLP